jgi:CarD family transcriptional regulator
MASAKKTMKSSKTKQANKTKHAKQPATPKAKASKQSAVLNAKRAAAVWALASKKPATNKSPRKTKTKTAVVARRASSPVAARPAARKKPSGARAAPRPSNTIRAAKKGTTRSAKPVLAHATRAKRGASARAKAKAVSGKTARAASVNKPARGMPAAAPKKTPAIEVSRSVDAKPAMTVRKGKKTAASKAAAAAILALKRNAATLSEARKQAASPPVGRPAGKSSKLDLASKERAVIKKSEQEISTGSGLGPTDAIAARVPGKRGAAGSPSQAAAAKGSGKPFAARITAKALDSQTPPSIERRPGARATARLDAAQTNMAEAKPGEKSVPPAHKPAKTATPQRQLFKPHEYVVYPAHGVGQIVAIEEQEVAGFKLELFVVRFVRDKMILKVPTPKAASVGMRRLADAPAVKAALDTLTGRARIKRTMWSRRAQEYEAKINSGDLKAIAEVVRDLYRSDTQPEQSYSERQLYETALDRMAREILVVQKLTETESLKVIETQLQKGPRRGKTEESEAEEAEIEQAA